MTVLQGWEKGGEWRNIWQNMAKYEERKNLLGNIFTAPEQLHITS